MKQARLRAGLAFALCALLLSGCAGLVFGRSAQIGTPYIGDGPSMLRIAVWEPVQPLLVPHAALIIHAPDGHILYDPAGWTPDPRAQRKADVTYGVTPDIEQAFLMRAAMPMLRGALQSVARPQSWELYLFELEVPDAVALDASRLAQDRPALPMASCAFGVSTLLRQLPGFEDISPCWLPQTLRQQLERRADLTLTRHLVP